MALFDKVKNWVAKNPDKAGQAIEKVGDLVDKQTKGKYAGQVDKAQSAARTYVNKNNPQGPVNPQNPPLHP